MLKKLGNNLEVEFDDGLILKNSFLIGVAANGKYYGGGYKCAPLANLNDGIIDLCLITKLSRLNILMLLDSYKKGTHLDNDKINKFITYRKCKNVNIKSNESFNLCIDGENILKNDIELKVINKALNFWVPDNVSLLSD